jgi:hypothetical protein
MITQNAANIAIVASAQTYVSYINFMYAGQTTNAYGSLIYSNALSRFQFLVAGTEYMRLTTTGLGLGTTTPAAPVHAAGPYASSVATGILGGVDPTTVTTAKLCICAGSATGLANLDFAYNGQLTTGTAGSGLSAACKVRISCNMSTGQLLFTTQQSATPALVIDGSTANQTILIGTTTTSSTYKLYVSGNSYFNGTISSSSTKPFDIHHPCKPNYRLRHRCIEMPKAVNAYRFTLLCVLGRNEFDLPCYFEALNTAASVIAGPADSFGAAYGSCSTDGSNTLTLFCSCEGTFNVLVMADRNDQVAQDEFAEFGVEYETPL